MNPTLKTELISFISHYHIHQNALPTMNDSDEEVINFMITAGSYDTRVNFEIPLISALLQVQDYDLAKQVMNIEGLDVNARDSNLKTPLTYAIFEKNPDIMTALAKLDANTSRMIWHNRDKCETRFFLVPEDAAFTIREVILGDEDQFYALEDVNEDVAFFLGNVMGFQYGLELEFNT